MTDSKKSHAGVGMRAYIKKPLQADSNTQREGPAAKTKNCLTAGPV